MRHLLSATVLGLALVLTACGGSSTNSFKPTLPDGINDVIEFVTADGSALISSPSSLGTLSVAHGTSVTVSFYYVYRSGGSVKWRRQDTGVTSSWLHGGTAASLDASGVIQGLAAGSDTVRIAYQGNKCDLNVNVL